METVHAHRILEWIAESEAGREIDEIVSFSDETYGEEAAYHTCSLSGMKIQELIEFFLEAGKVHVEGTKLSLNRAKMCSH